MRRSITATLRAIRASSLATGGGATFFVALLFVNGSNFAFHLVISRELGPTSYGALGAVLSLLLVLSVPVSALQATVTREVASRRGRRQGAEHFQVLVAPLLADAVIVGVAGAAVMLAASPAFRSFLHLPSLTSAVLLAVYVLPVAIGLVPKAVLLGELRYPMVSVALLTGVGVRLVVGIVAVRSGAGVNGAIAATVIGEVVTVGILLPPLRRYVHSEDEHAPIRLRLSNSLPAIVAFTGFWLLTATDTILARHYLPRVQSGLYAAANTAAGTALFLPGAIGLIAFPRFAEITDEGPERRRLLFQALGAVATLSVGAALVVLMAPGLLVRILFGGAFDGSATTLAILVVSAVFLGLTSVLLFYHLAADRRGASALCLVGVVTLSVGVVALHGSLTAIALVALTSTALVFVLMMRAALVAGARPPVHPPSRELWEGPGPSLDLTVVVPYYNPGDRLHANLRDLISALDAGSCRYEVIAVSDGSTDGSESRVAGLRSDVLRHAVLPRNHGKGQALRVGLSMGRGRYLGFIDADGDIAPALVTSFLALIEAGKADVVLGSKRHPDSEVVYSVTRRMFSWGYQQLVRTLFHLAVRDTQTGLKLVRREVVAAALPRMLEKRFAFDLELIVVAHRLGYTRFVEAPVTIGRRFSSTISPRAVWGMFLDTLAIFYRLRLLRFYDQASPDVTPAVPVVAG